VLAALAVILLLGGGRRWLMAVRARRALERAGRPDITPQEVAALAAHGRPAVMDLFRLQGSAVQSRVREAAGRALASLWARDQLVAEEEKAIVTRGFVATWQARRRYPRALSGPIPIAVEYGVPFLRDEAEEVGQANLEWSYRILGAERASLESFTPWEVGPGRAVFPLEPSDFPTNGPHRLILQARARTRGLTSSWELDLPHVPFPIEFDPLLRVDALMTLPDETRRDAFPRSVCLLPSNSPDKTYLVLNEAWALRDPPVLAISTPLPCDLAHTVTLEFEGLDDKLDAQAIILSGQGSAAITANEVRTFALAPRGGLSMNAFGRPGSHRMRAVLRADPDLGWADPNVRSLWPESIATEWSEVRVVRV
jgi:hypothetical protein